MANSLLILLRSPITNHQSPASTSSSSFFTLSYNLQNPKRILPSLSLSLMASVFLYHVVGDLTVGKPEMVEFYETETVESAIRAIGESTECGIPVWRKRSSAALPPGLVENSEMRQQRFVGILSSLDIVAFLAKSECLQEDKAMKIPVSQVITPNNTLLKQVDPGTR